LSSVNPTVEAESHAPDSPINPVEVVYLFGAGASHGCAAYRRAPREILMKDLILDIHTQVISIVEQEFPNNQSIQDVVNKIGEGNDYEQIITFLDESPSDVHRRFSGVLKDVFEKVLTNRLDYIEDELAEVPNQLYTALLDLHGSDSNPEKIKGFLTLNYDHYLDDAVRNSSHYRLNLGIETGSDSGNEEVKLLKLHGSLDWTDSLPVRIDSSGKSLWIPPGIQKNKQRYPFNLIWGQARELLDCDVIRIIGVNLGANDWDLISLLFSASYGQNERRRPQIEVIDFPSTHSRIQRELPYFESSSVLDLPDIAPFIVGELGQSPPIEFESLDSEHQKRVMNNANGNINWFQLWLQHKAEYLVRNFGASAIPDGALNDLVGK